MKDYKLTREERETIITFSDADKTATVFSESQTWINKIIKLGGKRYGAGAEVDVPKGWIKITKPRQYSETTRREMAKRLKKARNTQKPTDPAKSPQTTGKNKAKKAK